MTGWFDPGQLVRTGVRKTVSELFGQNADRRILDALAHHDVVPCELAAGDELWIDYVSDTGDGWNATYAVAHAIAQPRLAVRDPAGRVHETARGHLLVFGGDEVYPTPSRAAYEQKLVAPFATALPDSAAPHPAVFAVPGNHDWYDSLVAFTRLFCGTRPRWIGGWQAMQTLSYFAVRLPHRWWLVGTDVQLDSDIDDPQLEYFRTLAAQMPPDARVILCTAEPHWIDEARYAKYDPTQTERNLEFLERDVFGGRIEVFLSGDLHHYRRHATPDGRQKIVAGGGGSFIHPTHHDVREVETLYGGYEYKAAYPSPRESKRLSYGNLVFARHNPKFGLVTGVLYLLLGWAVQARVSAYGLSSLGAVFSALRDAVLASHVAVLWLLVVVFGFIFFTDTASPTQKRLGGTLHALAHLGAAFGVGWGGAYAARHVFGFAERSWQALSITGAALLIGGYVCGGVIMGLYLLISLNVFARHNTEAFSSLRIEDFRSWLRLHVARDGALHIYPVGIERVARRWTAATPSAERPSRLVPNDPDATAPHLIERPIVLS